MVVSFGSRAPANPTRKHVYTVESALLSFPTYNSSKEMLLGCQEGSPHQTFHLTPHPPEITSHRFGSETMTKWLLRVDPKISLPSLLFSFVRVRDKEAGKKKAVSLGSHEPILVAN